MVLASRTTPEFRPAFDAVVWDYDGTLVATRAADEHAVDLLLERDPSAVSGVAIFWASEGAPLEDRIERSWPGRVDEIRPLFENDIGPVPFHGIRTTLHTLHQRGYAMAVVSSRRRPTLEWGLSVTQLAKYFDAVISLDDVSVPKPAPEGLLAALRHLSVDPSRAVYVGDSEVDVLAGRRGGVTVWRATWSHLTEVHDMGARLIQKPTEVLDLVDLPPFMQPRFAVTPAPS